MNDLQNNLAHLQVFCSVMLDVEPLYKALGHAESSSFCRLCMASFIRSNLDPQRFTELNNVNVVCRSHDDPMSLVYPVCHCTVSVGYRVTFPNISMQNQAFVGPK